MRLFVAASFADRLQGLLGRQVLDPGQGLLLLHCAGVHSLFMGYPLALVFFNAQGQVLSRCACFAPWRFARHGGAAAVLEMHAQSSPAEQTLLERRAARVLRAVRR
jgi:uncharacterized membrane protein (UPF0127 family)